MSKSIDNRLAAIEKKLGITQITRALIIQDKSGSMGNRVTETIEGYNEYIKGLKEDDSDELILTLVQFDHEYVVVEESTPIAKVEDLNTVRYSVRGSTALLDAVGKGLTDLRSEMNEGDRALVVIMTDGGENSSNIYSKAAINKLIDKCEKDGNYTFLFLGAGRDSWHGAELMGLSREKAVFYSGTPQAQSAAFKSMSASTSGYRRSSSLMSEDMGKSTSEAMASMGGEVELEENPPTPLWTPGEEEEADAEE